MVDEILADGQMDGIEKIERLEAILSAVTGTSNDLDSIDSNTSNRCSPTKCNCMCQGNKYLQNDVKVQKKESSCQTLSTGDIVITRLYADEEDERGRLTNSPKKRMF